MLDKKSIEKLPELVLLAAGDPTENPAAKTGGGQASNEKRKNRILVVDDEPVIADTIVDILNGSGFDAQAIYNGRDAVEQVRELCPDVIISDVVMPKMNGIEMAIAIRNKCPKTRVLLISGQAGTVDLLETARKQGHTFEILQKPLRPEILLKKLTQ
ncbi:MAG TPA: response regulator [Terriglobales bacterium]|nr:response regulator [Terriglobales bacterium]